MRSKGKIEKAKGKLTIKRIFLVMVSLIVLFSSSIFFQQEDAKAAGLTTVGPISGDNGFPVWYQDATGLKLQLCLDGEFCTNEVPNPSEPISFPNNFPGEAFYQLAGSEMETGSGEKAVGVFDLEAAFDREIPIEGEQIVFGRVRIRVDGLLPNTEYTVTHPYGTDIIPTDEEGDLNFTEDLGISDGFTGALKSRIGPFLQWDPAVEPQAPPGYIGDPNVEHPIVGSVLKDKSGKYQNYFRIEGPGIGTGSPNACSNDQNNCIETKLFSLMGKEATNEGVDVQQATYNRTTADGGTIDVFAASETSQSIVVEADNVTTTTLNGGNGQYFARVAYTGEVPEKITVANVGDEPDSIKEVTPVDRISGTAHYDTTNKTLTVTAESSDKYLNPVLTVKGFGDIPASGTLTVTELSYTPPAITITSAQKGSVTIPVNLSGNPIAPNPVISFAGTDQTVAVGAQGQITLDGSNSSGPIESYLWEFVSGPESIVLTENTTAQAVFNTPTVPGDYIFRLTVSGAGGTLSSTSTVKITIIQTAPDPVAVIKDLDQPTVKQGTAVTLDGSGSQNAASYSWRQVSGPTVDLNSVDTNKPTLTFTFPKKPESVVFELTATGPGGSAVDTIEISTVPDILSNVVAEYRRSKAEWRIDGRSDVAGAYVTIYVVDSLNPTGRVIAKDVLVDTLGNFRYLGPGLPPSGVGTIKVVSTSGGILQNQLVRVR